MAFGLLLKARSVEHDEFEAWIQIDRTRNWMCLGLARIVKIMRDVPVHACPEDLQIWIRKAHGGLGSYGTWRDGRLADERH